MSQDISKRDRAYVWHPFTQMYGEPVHLPVQSASGAYLTLEDGRQVLDAVSSWWVNIHGHGNKEIADRVHQQMLELEHVIFAGFTHEPAVQISERLVKKAGRRIAKAFFSDNGSTAVEVGIKMAIQSFHNRDIPRKKIIAFEGAYHGDTFGAMSAAERNEFNAAFDDYLFDVVHIPSPVPGSDDQVLSALDEALKNMEPVGVIFEPMVQGAGGMIMHDTALLTSVLQKVREKGGLLIADEVMTGFYRTGKFLATEHLEIAPDIVCISKGITGGTMPLSMTLCSQEIYDSFISEDKTKTFFHGHSYTANPVACAAALASLDILERSTSLSAIQGIVDSHAEYSKKLKELEHAGNVRQCGTILAFDIVTGEGTTYFNSIRDQAYDFFLSRDVLLRPLGNVIYCMPPYCFTDTELSKVYQVIDEFLQSLNS